MWPRKRVTVYIDGLNLYYLAVKRTGQKWVDIGALVKAVLPSDLNITAINYYTAHVSGKFDPSAPHRQNAYLRALDTIPNLSIHYGHFVTWPKWQYLVRPYDFRPATVPPVGFAPDLANVWRPEEKGSDVNLGAHLVRDAFRRRFDVAAVLSNDTDLKEPIRIVVQELGKSVILLCPDQNPASSLEGLATSVRHVRPYVGPCQFPNPVIGPDGRQIQKPTGW